MRLHPSVRMLLGLVAGLVLGVTAHLVWGDAAALQQFVRFVTEPAGKIFLRLLFVLVIPLIVSALVPLMTCDPLIGPVGFALIVPVGAAVSIRTSSADVYVMELLTLSVTVYWYL